MAADCPGSCEEDEVESKLRERILLDAVATEEQCRAILRLTKAAAVLGDGYGGDSHPFSPFERFLGLTPTAAARWTVAQPPEERLWADDAVRTLIAVARAMRGATREGFQKAAAGDLEDDFVHLACREAEEALDPEERAQAPTDRYIFADNCWKRNQFECAREKPFFHWRTYSAMLFLHDVDDEDVQGGNFLYSSDWNGTRTAFVHPKCGRMAAYNAGPANLHAIDWQVRGRSCYLSVYMTNQTGRAAHRRELTTAEAILRGEAPPDMSSGEGYVRRYYDLCSEHATNGHQVTAPQVAATAKLREETFMLDGRALHVKEALADPQLTVIENFLSEEEREHLVRRGTPKLKASLVWEHGELVTAKYRSSRTAWLDRTIDPVVDRVERRIALLTGLDLQYAEDMQIAFYAAGDLGRYEPHYDWGTVGTPDGVGEGVNRNFTHSEEPPGGRIATFLMYLKDVPAGGHTVFTESNLTVAPRAGSALFWYNLHPNRQGDVQVRHGACPVIRGDKYVATKWIHERGNEHLFPPEDTSWRRLVRNWAAVAAEASKADGAGKLPAFLPETCRERSQNGACMEAAPWMTRNCPDECAGGVEPADGLRHCSQLVSANKCMDDPLMMAQSCPDSCEDARPSSALKNRTVFDRVLQEPQCETLLRVSQLASPGDGYGGETQPFTQHENFAGITPTAAARAAVSEPEEREKRRAARDVMEFLDAARRAKAQVEAWLGGGITTPAELEFDYIHLVCREAVMGGVDADPARPDSHQAHADNCWFDGETRCVRADPYYYWRSHSAVLYLDSPSSQAFQGGDFFYAPTPKSQRRTYVQPACGRMVAFSAGPENIHGVTPVTRGRRCAIGIWLTDNATLARAAGELDRAEEILRGTRQ